MSSFPERTEPVPGQRSADEPEPTGQPEVPERAQTRADEPEPVGDRTADQVEDVPNKGLLERTRLLDVSSLRRGPGRDEATERLDASDLAGPDGQDPADRDVPPAIPPQEPADTRGQGPGGSAERRSRRSRTRRVLTSVAVVLVVVLVLAGVGTVLAERWLAGKVDSAVRGAMPGLAADAQISTEGYLLPQAWNGRLDVLNVRSSGLHLGGLNITAPPGPDGTEGNSSVPVTDLNLTSVTAAVRRIELQEPHTASSVQVSADLPWGQVSQVVTALMPDLSGIKVVPASSGAGASGEMVATASIGVADVELQITPAVSRDGGLTMTITRARIGFLAFTPSDGSLPSTALSYLGLDSSTLTIEPGALPKGMRATGVSVVSGGLHLTLEGSDVALDDL